MQHDHKQQRREATIAECAKRGIKIKRRGECYVLTGIGVSVQIFDLADVSHADLKPYQPRQDIT